MSSVISIIVPVYNVENILKYCVDSILKQTYKDLEILLVDDGSTDKSPALCDEYLSVDSRIKVFHKKNGGLSDARNYGIENATGSYFLFIDSDDVLHEDFCKVLMDLQKEHNAEITSTDLVNFYEISEIDNLNKRKYEPHEFVLKGAEILKEYFSPEGKTKIYHGLCMKLYKKELFENLRFTKGRLHEDLYITYQLLDLCKTFVFIDLPFYYYYQKNTGSITKNYREKNLVDEYDAVCLMENYFNGRKEVQDYLFFFLLNHYNYLYTRTYEVQKSENVKEKRKQIRKFILKNINETSLLSKKAKVKLVSRVRFFVLYNFLGKVKGKLRNVK